MSELPECLKELTVLQDESNKNKDYMSIPVADIAFKKGVKCAFDALLADGWKSPEEQKKTYIQKLIF